MTVTVTCRQVDVPSTVRAQIERKVARLERLLRDNGVSAQCVLTRERAHVCCELTVHARGDHQLVAIGKHARAVTAANLAVEKVSQQAQRLMDRWKTRRRANGRALVEREVPAAAERTTRVIRARNTAIKAMTVDDAVLALEAAKQPFLVFRHHASEAVAILFRRPDGHLGLIDTES
ncbi:MAG TPA: HPF/RaiA family ribosome-associated protein [Vicinamibacterales bacterium]|jgi:ribosomal subunit interface protein|nr:HPF/RaiA family ribosome-associated protein [Vicinamibacterales bacterium]